MRWWWWWLRMIMWDWEMMIMLIAFTHVEWIPFCYTFDETTLCWTHGDWIFLRLNHRKLYLKMWLEFEHDSKNRGSFVGRKMLGWYHTYGKERNVTKRETVSSWKCHTKIDNTFILCVCWIREKKLSLLFSGWHMTFTQMPICLHNRPSTFQIWLPFAH